MFASSDRCLSSQSLALLQRRDDAARVLRLFTAELSVELALLDFRLDPADAFASLSSSSSAGDQASSAMSSSSFAASAAASSASLQRSMDLNERDNEATVGASLGHSVCLRALVHGLDALRRPDMQVAQSFHTPRRFFSLLSGCADFCARFFCRLFGFDV